METSEALSPRARAHLNGHSKHPRTLSCDDLRARDLTRPSLSPRQTLQSRIRNLGHDSNPVRHKPTPQEESNSKSKHASNSKVEANQAADRQSQDTQRPALIFRHSVDSPYDFYTNEEPDFVLEERAAWNQLSPECTRAQRGRYRLFPRHRSTQSHNDFIFIPSQDNGSPSVEAKLQLKQFAPLHRVSTDEERPKTSRGQLSEHSENTVDTKDLTQKLVSYTTQKSKFNEGSMGDRSKAVASTWNETASFSGQSSDQNDTDTDSEATPKASRMSRDSGSSFDLTEFKPQSSSTSATIKKRFSKLANTFKVGEEPKQQSPEKTENPKKRLRKSISTWSLHSIGEKMKIFGNSATSIPPTEDCPAQKATSETHLLNERKRKANEAYAEQFGFKKQKPDSTSSEKSSSYGATTVHKRSMSIDRTIKASRATQRGRDSISQSTFNLDDPAETLPEFNSDLYKRPTRRELEQENQQLRAILRERQIQARADNRPTHKSALVSTLHLPLEQAEIHTYIFNDPLKKPVGTFHAQDIPPVPALPSRAVLGQLENNRNYAKDTGTVKRVSAVLPRPVSTILEADEGAENRCPAVSKTLLAKDKTQTHWEWPEDVF